MRLFTLFFLLFSSKMLLMGQSMDSCMLVGSYTLNRVEMSQSLDSNSRVMPSMRWSLYENALNDTLTIHDGFEFMRSLNFNNYFSQISTGKFTIQQDSLLTIAVSKGQLYTMPILNIEALNPYELIITERFKTRWMRRTFLKNALDRP